MINPKLTILLKESFHVSDKDMLEPYVMKVTRTVLRRGQNGNILTLSDK